MTMTREDMLRELELLPVWQLRAPVVTKNEQVQTPQTVVPATIEKASAPQFRMIVSDDAHYLLVLSPTQNAEEETLLQNMLKSICAKTRMDIGSQSIGQVSENPTKVIVAMGETAAQALLNATEMLENLRGKLHQTQPIPVVVTYHPRHLLINAADKANAWEDLCLAKAHVNKI